MDADLVESCSSTDGVPSQSSREQASVEHACRALFSEWIDLDGTLHRASCVPDLPKPCARALTAPRCRGRVALRRPEHISYLLAGLGSLNSNYSSLDASRPWLAEPTLTLTLTLTLVPNPNPSA